MFSFHVTVSVDIESIHVLLYDLSQPGLEYAPLTLVIVVLSRDNCIKSSTFSKQFFQNKINI